MKRYKKIFAAMATKYALEVYMYVYYRYTTKELPSFDEIRKALKLAKGTLRRITNYLSRCDMICSVHPENEPDGRKRVYTVKDPRLAEIIRSIYTI